MAIFASAETERTYQFRALDNFALTSANTYDFEEMVNPDYIAVIESVIISLTITTNEPSMPEIPFSGIPIAGFYYAVDAYTDRYFLMVRGTDMEIMLVCTSAFGRALYGWLIPQEGMLPFELPVWSFDTDIEIDDGLTVRIDTSTIQMQTDVPPSEMENYNALYGALYQFFDYRIPPEEGALKVVDFYKNLSNAFLTSTEALWGAEWTQMHNYFAVFFGAFLVASVASWITYYIKRRR